MRVVERFSMVSTDTALALSWLIYYNRVSVLRSLNSYSPIL
ncbi:hypothetical protein FDUTEX481_01223 [Tolypothrix sp. PCC 7601]|nr:hypothetical protein FDUTEX481_01223 [Tolypothrix sp. PCC 7601]